MSYCQRISALKCSHPAVVAFWETGGTGKYDGDKLVHYFHILTIDDQRFDIGVDYDNPKSENAAFDEINAWLDKKYPTIKEVL